MEKQPKTKKGGVRVGAGREPLPAEEQKKYLPLRLRIRHIEMFDSLPDMRAFIDKCLMQKEAELKENSN